MSQVLTDYLHIHYGHYTLHVVLVSPDPLTPDSWEKVGLDTSDSRTNPSSCNDSTVKASPEAMVVWQKHLEMSVGEN